MPTGYTADIAKGISFKQYALSCARAFGALISMRDEPMSAEIPDVVESEDSSYHNDSAMEALFEIQFLKSLNKSELEVLVNADYKNRVEENEKSRREKIELKHKYEAMLEKAKAYEPPTSEHVRYKEFMIEQIQSSIEHDCDLSYYKKPRKLSAEGYRRRRLEAQRWDFTYHANAAVEQKQRAVERNLWVKNLKESLQNIN